MIYPVDRQIEKGHPAPGGLFHYGPEWGDPGPEGGGIFQSASEWYCRCRFISCLSSRISSRRLPIMTIRVSVWSCSCLEAFPFLRVMIAQATTTTRTPMGPMIWLISVRPSTLFPRRQFRRPLRLQLLRRSRISGEVEGGWDVSQHLFLCSNCSLCVRVACLNRP